MMLTEDSLLGVHGCFGNVSRLREQGSSTSMLILQASHTGQVFRLCGATQAYIGRTLDHLRALHAPHPRLMSAKARRRHFYRATDPGRRDHNVSCLPLQVFRGGRALTRDNPIQTVRYSRLGLSFRLGLRIAYSAVKRPRGRITYSSSIARKRALATQLLEPREPHGRGTDAWPARTPETRQGFKQGPTGTGERAASPSGGSGGLRWRPR